MIHRHYECSTLALTVMDETIWEHRCVRIDKKVGICVHYNPAFKRCAQPLIHVRTPQESVHTPLYDCPIIGAPCEAELVIEALFSGQYLHDLHGQSFEPPKRFWELLIEWVEQRKIPWEQ